MASNMGVCMHIDGVTCDNCRINQYAWPYYQPPCHSFVDVSVAVNINRIADALERIAKALEKPYEK